MKLKMKQGNSIATPAFAAIEPKFNHSRENSISMFNHSADTLLPECKNEDDSQALSFIEEYAFGDKSQAVCSLIKSAHYSETNEYEVSEDDIYRDLASKEHQDFVDFIESDQLLDFESIA